MSAPPFAEGRAAPFASPAPIVRLVNAFADPYNNAIATARTCYSARLVTAADVQRDARAREQRDAIAKSTYAAGHHTIWQHAAFQFALDNVSRQLVWSFLHAHPFYNSEQVSQRYVAVQAEKVIVPALPPRQRVLFEETVAAQARCYHELVELLFPKAAQEYFGIFPGRERHRDKYRGAIVKRAQEVARYVLPIGTFAHLYHTVSGITLHRYHRLCNMLDVPSETRLVVGAMVDEVRRHDPLFFSTLEDPVPLAETLEAKLLSRLGDARGASAHRAARDAFDRELAGRRSRLIDYTANAEGVVARAVRTMLGVTAAELNDEAALAAVLAPAENPYLAGPLDLLHQAKLTRALSHPYYTFQKKLSHSADSQDQRHRLTPASRPVLAAQYVGGEPDLVVPPLLESVEGASARFFATMRATWHAIDALLADGVVAEHALYLLPNAFPIRFDESGDLAALHHKWTTRLCYNAQEEIWRASLEEVSDVAAVHPRIGRFLGPPCAQRAAAAERPVCPEGARFCGVPVWRQAREDYRRVL